MVLLLTLGYVLPGGSCSRSLCVRKRSVYRGQSTIHLTWYHIRVVPHTPGTKYCTLYGNGFSCVSFPRGISRRPALKWRGLRCQGSRIEVEGSPFTGSALPPAITISSGYVRVVYADTEYVRQEGFRASWYRTRLAKLCGGIKCKTPPPRTLCTRNAVFFARAFAVLLAAAGTDCAYLLRPGALYLLR